MDLEEFIDYEFIPSSESDKNVPVKVLTGIYKDVIVRFGTVTISEQENGEALVKFNYQLVEPVAVDQRNALNDDRNFKNFLGELLRCIVVNTGSFDENRTDYIEELDSQRRVLAEDPSIFEE